MIAGALPADHVERRAPACALVVGGRILRHLRDDATSEERGAIEAIIDQSGVGAAREYVSKAEALTRFAASSRTWRRWPRISTTIHASVEVRLRPEAEPTAASAVVKRLGSAAGVADVGYDSEWPGRVAATCEPCAVPVWLGAVDGGSGCRHRGNGCPADCMRGEEIEIMSLSGPRWPSSVARSSPKGCCRVVSGRSLRCCCWGPHSPSPSPGGERTFRRF